MKFKISRTSIDDDAALPCEEANHEVIEGRIAWFAEIESLAALLAFTRKHGRIVVKPAEKNKPSEIEIYDDWRE
jgi:hypothetical protein